MVPSPSNVLMRRGMQEVAGLWFRRLPVTGRRFPGQPIPARRGPADLHAPDWRGPEANEELGGRVPLPRGRRWCELPGLRSRVLLPPLLQVRGTGVAGGRRVLELGGGAPRYGRGGGQGSGREPWGGGACNYGGGNAAEDALEMGLEKTPIARLTWVAPLQERRGWWAASGGGWWMPLGFNSCVCVGGGENWVQGLWLQPFPLI